LNNLRKDGAQDKSSINKGINVPHPISDILIADDNAAILGMLAEIFSEQGHSVRTACDGFAALDAIRERAPDILLSDLNMPRMSGYELLAIVRRRFPQIAVIAMSADYSGVAIPPGIAADGFYAKGSGRIARLIEILHNLQNDETRQSLRVAVPVWITRSAHHEEDLSTSGFACPDCSKTFSPSFDCVLFDRHKQLCPHCSSRVQVAVLRQRGEEDHEGTPSARAPEYGEQESSDGKAPSDALRVERSSL
jgi:CheY-like chemotaxis protein